MYLLSLFLRFVRRKPSKLTGPFTVRVTRLDHVTWRPQFNTISTNKWRCNKNVKHLKMTKLVERFKEEFSCIETHKTCQAVIQCLYTHADKHKTLDASIFPPFISLQKAVQKPNNAWSKKQIKSVSF
jgi:hypothetical protein